MRSSIRTISGSDDELRAHQLTLRNDFDGRRGVPVTFLSGDRYPVPLLGGVVRLPFFPGRSRYPPQAPRGYLRVSEYPKPACAAPSPPSSPRPPSCRG